MTSAPLPTSVDNHVQLRGRLAAEPTFREMPSGDTLAVFSLIVARPASDRARVDTLECASASAKVHSALGRVEPGQQFEVVGSLRRRFWRTPAGVASRYAVDVVALKITRTGRRGAASRARKLASA